MPRRDDATSEKVQMAFLLMVVGEEGFRGAGKLVIAERICELQGGLIAAMLNDDAGEVRERANASLRKLWAIYEERTEGQPWNLPSTM